MANAVLRVGATPVFSDIEATTFGSDPHSIERSISSQTRMVVAQHSFGYACEIESILAITQAAQIFLLEDCATSLGTTVNGVQVGDFGDAAIFSTDHTKPINTLIGGLLYSRNSDLISRVRAEEDRAAELPMGKQQAILNRLLRESACNSPSLQWRLNARDTAMWPVARLSRATSPFLDEDYLPGPGAGTYSYPARFPPFLALLGLQQIANWPQVQTGRVASLEIFRDSLANTSIGRFLPTVLGDPRQSIVPLRLAWSQPDAVLVRRRLHSFTTSEGTWFMKPIVATPADPEDFGYQWGTCPTAELAGPNMVNLPVPSSQDDAQQLSELVVTALLSP
jgi:dTDP-4-amino-4,6-dideoxygalactose transaminase